MKRGSRVAWIMFCCMLPALTVLAAAIGQPVARPMVAQIALDGPIGPAAAEYFDDASKRAVADGAAAIVLRLDTPGGLADSMRQIIAGMLASKVPVLVYVAPAGARAASAGTYILYAGQIAAMAPATHLGAATPVALGGGRPMPLPKAGRQPASATTTADDQTAADDAESHKAMNDAIAYIRSLAQLRGRNAAWAEQAVRGAATLTASEAAQQQVIDFVAADVAELLARADGRKVRVGERDVTLQLKGASVREYAPGARTRFLAIITNPTIAYLLLLAGIFGLALEAMHPGAMLPGIAGGICLLVGLYALQLLPVNYAGLALMALGVGLLVAEAANPSVGAFGVGGLVSFVTGSVMLMNTGVPGYGVNLGVIAGIAVCAAGLLVLIVWLVFRSRRAHPVTGDAAMLMDTGELLEPVSAGGEAWMLVRGERWRVRCDTALPAGARVRVVSRQGLLLQVEPA
ncbi:NfeD family protein [Rhodanobacter denitrificans]|uniref:Membrane-bound serine protease (ClpP class) n=1 Tax=Rhodanobacter denitrificans TaxID=666685 RepID=M4NIQ9_9GAMM|nr:nodulation protein NfeD [Rhodanobacter denitrificans]AGG89548.1 membrane-bound serine protease (ClpP class) [Rhodanobacter denitrificans]UJM88426.1 nodulation protein NfeD [Rhodanobacter denitrificans]